MSLIDTISQASLIGSAGVAAVICAASTVATTAGAGATRLWSRSTRRIATGGWATAAVTVPGVMLTVGM